MRYEDIQPLGRKIQENISRVLVGGEEAALLLLTAMLAGGHALMVDVPGTGKTTLAKTFARSVSGRFERIQFTPDLLPSDVTGTRVWQQDQGKFAFMPGPVFCNILLADEINRATPRTQSAMLECMAEEQVTEGGETHPLPSPFLVIATQNPVETQGTFPLPEAQLDRFMLQFSLGYPSRADTVALLRRFQKSDPLAEVEPAASAQDLLDARALCRECEVSADILDYMAGFAEAARNPNRVRLGPSPRAVLCWLRASQAYAALHGRGYVIPDDVKRLAVPVLAHRLLLRGLGQTDTPASFLTELLNTVPVPTEKRE